MTDNGGARTSIILLAIMAVLGCPLGFLLGHSQGMDDAASQGCVLHDSSTDILIHEFTGQ